MKRLIPLLLVGLLLSSCCVSGPPATTPDTNLPEKETTKEERKFSKTSAHQNQGYWSWRRRQCHCFGNGAEFERS